MRRHQHQRRLGFDLSTVVPGLFAFTVFFGAVLLFSVEPYVSKSLLPLFGGSPAVWNTCVFFFQFVLLIGYVYVYVINRYLSIPSQLLVHGLAITAAVATLPLRFSTVAATQVSEQPIASLIRSLAFSAGLPFLITATTAPLAQAWYVRMRFHGSPYWLYVGSNAGSLLALVAYPTVVENWLALKSQSSYWSYSFFAFACLLLACGLCAHFCRRETFSARSEPSASDVGVTPRLRLTWLVLSLCPSSLMLGVTIYLSTEIAPIPVLWVLPLAVYLLSLIIAFANPPTWLVRMSQIGYIVLAVLISVSQQLLYRSDLFGVLFHVTLLLLGGTALHSQLARLRPTSAHLTEYYLWISLGGVCGGITSSLLAPVLFNWLAEYPLAIVLGLVLIPWPWRTFRPGRRIQVAIRLFTAALALLGLSWNVYFSPLSRYVMHRERTFFGPFSVVQGTRGVTHVLFHGTTIHGIQNVGGLDSRARRAPLTYYFWNGPVGKIFIAYRGTAITQSVGIVGLGIGSLASYGEPGQDYTFYEIDPAIEQVARNPHWFTFLDDAEARGVRLHIKIGDARLRLCDAPDQAYGVLVLDAFTSDSIPMHLLTREAVALYLSKLKPGGFLAFHISNHYVNLEPVLSNIAAELGLVAYIQIDDCVSDEETRLGKTPSTWLVMAPSRENLKPLVAGGRWRYCWPRPKVRVWTDDWSNLLRALRW
jgi:hypothetical protein